MQYKLIVLFILLVSGLSCTRKNSFPEKKTNRIPISGESETYFLVNNLSNGDEKWNEIDTILNQYFLKNPEFSLTSYKKQWKIFNENNQPADLAPNELIKWIETAGLLFELTGNAGLAEEMEDLVHIFPNVQNIVDPFVFTRNIDHIHINLLKNREIEYMHTLGGAVKIRLETKFPDSGKVRIHFKMAEKRYIELYIRIPSWAENAAVTVKNVKYSAPPGAYCKIAKQWRDGDVAELDLPAKKLPDFYFQK
jgi:hypothetical protein